VPAPLLGRDPWEAAYPLASLGFEPRGRRSGAVPAFVFAGLLFVALALFVVLYSVRERHDRDDARFHMTGGGSRVAVQPSR
jgi:hypothetical protein